MKQPHVVEISLGQRIPLTSVTHLRDQVRQQYLDRSDFQVPRFMPLGTADGELASRKTCVPAKTLLRVLLAASCLASSGVFAQSSVELYGILDTGIEYLTHANAAGDPVVRMPAITGTVPSRWGLRGKEGLGGGYFVTFALENGFNMRAGNVNQGGRLFGRQAYVGINGPFGQLALGRQYTMTNTVQSDANIMGPDMYGLGSLDAYLPNARSDNTILYKGRFSGVSVGATYSNGRDAAGTGNSPGQGTCAGPIPGNGTACRQWSAMLRYDSRRFGVGAAYDEQRGGAGAMANLFNGLAPIPLTNPGDKDVRIQANGWAMLGKVKVGGGWLGRRVDTVSAREINVHQDIFYLGASYPVTYALTIEGELFRVVDQQQDTRASMASVAALYSLSKRASVYLQGGYVINSRLAHYTVSSGGPGATPGEGMNQLGLMVGLRENF